MEISWWGYSKIGPEPLVFPKFAIFWFFECIVFTTPAFFVSTAIPFPVKQLCKENIIKIIETFPKTNFT